MKRALLAAAAVAALMSTLSNRAFADRVYNFSYSDGTGSGSTSISGTVTAADTLTNGGYLINAINATGKFSNGSSYTFTALSSFGGADNLLFLTSPGVPGSGPYLDSAGFSFASGSNDANIYYEHQISQYNAYNNITSGQSYGGTFTLTAAVPEPSSLILVGTAGLMGLGYAARRRRRA